MYVGFVLIRRRKFPLNWMLKQCLRINLYIGPFTFTYYAVHFAKWLVDMAIHVETMLKPIRYNVVRDGKETKSHNCVPSSQIREYVRFHWEFLWIWALKIFRSTTTDWDVMDVNRIIRCFCTKYKPHRMRECCEKPNIVTDSCPVQMCSLASKWQINGRQKAMLTDWTGSNFKIRLTFSEYETE